VAAKAIRMSPIDSFLSRTHIAYFSMEMAIRPEMRTYAGGLGILAGDTARSCADLELPVVFVTLLSRAGYFRQTLDPAGRQSEDPDWWDPEPWCTPLDSMVAVEIAGRPVWIRAWLYIHTSPLGHSVPILLLDTDFEQNANDDRLITHHLYGGDDGYRLRQEIVLGLGGLKLLRAVGFDLHTYHLNEGHAALLTLGLLNRYREFPENVRESESPYDVGAVRERCVFTTHTPVEAGHDRFSYELFQRFLPDFVDQATLRRLAGADRLNMTRLALNLSGYINGVARRHVRTAEGMFPGYRIHAITNGVHVGTWTHEAFAALYRAHFPQWQHEPEILVRALQLPAEAVWRCHEAAKADLVARVGAATGVRLAPAVPIVAFARRMTGYKRPMLLFSDPDRLAAIASRHPLQVVVAGKAHPRDLEGKEAIRRLVEVAARLRGRVTCAFLPDYDMEMARDLVAGADIWLNTPQPPFEASGTSGMKAALNGGLNLSVLDGWWVEACVEGVTGWSIGEDRPHASDGDHADALYEKLDTVVLPLYHGDPDGWRLMMKQAIANIAYYFNSQRMMRRYATEAYLR
jgi:starch phosphorylase